MNPPSLWDRIRSARIFQVLAVYLGASWVVLQIADVLTDALALPKWVLPVAVLLLLAGLVIIVATAWVQSLPTTTAREAAGELPTDWQVAPADVLASLKAGKLPHLTWGRVVVAGVLALLLLFGGAGMYVLVTGTALPRLGPSDVVADVAAEGIAVVPFEVRGENLEIWREGMVDLLANNLDGVGGFRTIDPRTVMARWHEGVGDVANADLEAALRVARATGARYALLGSVVGIGENVRLVSNVYDLDTHEEVAQGQAEGPAGDVLRLVDDLAVGTIRSLLRQTGRQGAGDLQAETLTTGSLEALREFLEGERHYRKGDFAEAVQSFERAVSADSTFAIALVRLSEAYGWLENQNSERMQEYGERAMAHADRLPPRYRFIMHAWDALNHGTAQGVAALQQAVQKYPDDPEAWFLLVETYIHVNDATYPQLPDIQRAMDRAVALDPNFAPYRVHEADLAVIRGDRAAAEAARDRYVSLAGSDRGVRYLALAIPLLLGDSAEVEAAVAAARNSSAGDVDQVLGTFQGWVDGFDRLERLNAVLAEVSGANRDHWTVWMRTSQGALAAARELALAGELSPANLGIFLGQQYELWGVAPEGALAQRLSPGLCAEPFNSGCYAFVGEVLAGLRRWPELALARRQVRQAAESSAAAGDSAAAAARSATAGVLEGLEAWGRGDLPRARALLTPHSARSGLVGGRARAVLAQIEAAEGRWEQALHFAQGGVHGYARPRAFYLQAKAHEARGDTSRAREAWRHFVAITRRGDAAVTQIREGREALVRLGG